ncbi:MAG: histidine kinase [Bacteroidota bacterium]
MLYAQDFQPIFRQLKRVDGLPSNGVFSMFQDHLGYVWLGTDYGLARYDGMNFQTYHLDKPYYIYDLKEDELGRVWFSGAGGIKYAYQGAIHDPPNLHGVDSVLHKYGTMILSWHMDEKDHFWFTLHSRINRERRGTLDQGMEKNLSLYVFEAYGETLIAHSIKKFPYHQFNLIDPDNQKRLDQLLLFKIGEKWMFSGTQNYEHKGPDIPLTYHERIDGALDSYVSISNILALPDGDLLVVGGRNIYRLSDTMIKWKYTAPVESSITEICQGEKGQVWVCTFKGAYPLDPDHPESLGKECYLKGKCISEVFTDREGNTWFATTGSGVYVLPNESFSLLSWQGKVMDGHIEDLLVFNDKLWFYNRAGYYYALDTSFSIQEIAQIPSNKKHNWDIIQDDYILSSTQHIFLDENEIQKVPTQKPVPDPRMIWARKYIGIDSDRLFAVNKSGLELLDVAYQIRINVTNASEGRFATGDANDIVLGPDSTYWIASSKGIFGCKFDPRYYFPEHTKVAEGKVEKKADKEVLQLPQENYIDLGEKYPKLKVAPSDYKPMVSLAYGGNDEGLFYQLREGILHLRGDSVTLLDLGPDIGDYNGKIVWEEENLFWICSDLYLYKVERLHADAPWKLSNRFGRKDGLLGERVNDIAYFGDSYWISTDRGLIHAGTLEPVEVDYQPLIHVESIQGGGKEWSSFEQIDIEPAINDVEIHYRGFSYRNPEGISYEYRLLGFSEKWQATDLSVTQFTNLPPGTYVFEVRAVSTDYGSSARPAQLVFRMEPYLTETLWFQSLFVGFVVLAVLLIGLVILHVANRRVVLLRQLSETRYEALSSQMSPHFIFNAMNSILYLINKEERRSAQRYLTSLAKLMRSILVDAKETFAPLVDEMWRAQEYLDLEKLQFGGRLKFQIQGDELPEGLLIPQMVIQPFLENAIHHGIRPRGYGEIQLVLKDLGAFIQIMIIDDGVGMEAARKYQKENTTSTRLKGTGIGVKNTKERLKSIQQIYKIETGLRMIDRQVSEGTSGTVVEILFPKFEEVPKA